MRDRDAVVAGFVAGKRLLADQAIDVVELIAAGDRVAGPRDLAGNHRRNGAGALDRRGVQARRSTSAA